MNCHSTRAVLDLYLEQRLAPGRAAALEKHLSACASCRALSVPAPVTVAAAKAQPSAEPRPKIGGTLSLLPRDLLSVAAAALALGLIALGLGWNGAPNQSYAPEELAGRMP
jgi:predicted anti-sigma-YlaC factor YlaD